MPHSDQMRISERFHMVAQPGFLQNDVSITDPAYLTAPWTFSYLYKRIPDERIREYVCENNHAYVDDKGLTHVDFGGAAAARKGR